MFNTKWMQQLEEQSDAAQKQEEVEDKKVMQGLQEKINNGVDVFMPTHLEATLRQSGRIKFPYPASGAVQDEMMQIFD